MKSLYKTLPLLFILFFSLPAVALEYYWVGGSGMWSDHNNHWAKTSGGAVFHDQVPTSMDNVHFDANSFPVPGGTVTIDQTIIYCMDMDWTGATGTPVLTGPGDKMVFIYGSMTLIADMQWDVQGQVHFLAFQLGKEITLAGHSIISEVYFEGLGGEWILQDEFRALQNVVHFNGVLRSNDQTLRVRGHWNPSW
ncbi:MAG: hypothetical protein H7246_14535, partial [Phycisphaerae bacterium]|nr:hypothetical protein [Saprospiraceae bacterium]